MARVTVSIPEIVHPRISLEARKSGDRILLFGAVDAEDFDRLLAAGAEFEDVEDTHDREKELHD